MAVIFNPTQAASILGLPKGEVARMIQKGVVLEPVFDEGDGHLLGYIERQESLNITHGELKPMLEKAAALEMKWARDEDEDYDDGQDDEDYDQEKEWDEDETPPRVAVCKVCQGSGSCIWCGGGGRTSDGNCEKCKGSGECPRCEGMGTRTEEQADQEEDWDEEEVAKEWALHKALKREVFQILMLETALMGKLALGRLYQ